MKTTAQKINEALSEIEPAGGASLYTGEDQLVAPGGASMYTGAAREGKDDLAQVRGSADQYAQGQRDAEDGSMPVVKIGEAAGDHDYLRSVGEVTKMALEGKKDRKASVKEAAKLVKKFDLNEKDEEAILDNVNDYWDNISESNDDASNPNPLAGQENGEGKVDFVALTDQVVADMTNTLEDTDLSKVDESFQGTRSASGDVVHALRQRRAQAAKNKGRGPINEEFKILSKEEFSTWYNTPPVGPERKYWNSCVTGVEQCLSSCIQPESGDMADCYDSASYEQKRDISSCIAGNSISEAKDDVLSPGDFTKWHDQKPQSLGAGRKKFMDACDSIYAIFQAAKMDDLFEVETAYKKLDEADQKKVTKIARDADSANILIGESYKQGDRVKFTDPETGKSSEGVVDYADTRFVGIEVAVRTPGQKMTVKTVRVPVDAINESVVGPVTYVDTSPNNLTSYGNSEEAGRLTLAKVLRICAQMVGGSVDIPNLIVTLPTDDRVQKLLYAMNAHRGYISGLSRNEAAMISVITPSQTREFNFYPDGTITKVS